MNAPRTEKPLRRIALVGVPNCGKTALFNRLTGSRQKVANYPGVTVERKEGHIVSPELRRKYIVVDLPGSYSLLPTTLDEAITRDALRGRLRGEAQPDLLVCVVDATNLQLSLRLLLEVRELGLPLLVALNMSDLAAKRGFTLDRERLAAELGLTVIETVAVRSGGELELVRAIEALDFPAREPSPAFSPPAPSARSDEAVVEGLQRESRRILAAAGYSVPARAPGLERLDAIVLHPFIGPLLLALVLFLMFQAVFSWAQAPMGWISAGIDVLGQWVGTVMAEGPLRSLLVDGVLAGAGTVLVFLPQILILFAFILALEDSGYLPRAAFLLDRLMGGIGLSGRSFIPLLSSFACAIPGIMATRTIPNWRDRITTIMLAPLMTCSARLPVYALLIAAFIPDRAAGPFNLRGLVLFGLYLTGVLGAVLVALAVKLVRSRSAYHPLLMELPEYHWPNLHSLALGLWERTRVFMGRVGSIILALMVVLWFLASFPAPPPNAPGPAIQYSYAGLIGGWLEYVFAPLGFNWQISVALVPGLAAREVAVGALATVYALSAGGGDLHTELASMIGTQWSLATALSLLVWYIFAPQCISTLATVRRETHHWRYPLIMASYLFALAWLASFLTYRLALALGAGSP
jgi:ferrous iron transport protein B